jgi:hypothetical protein
MSVMFGHRCLEAGLHYCTYWPCSFMLLLHGRRSHKTHGAIADEGREMLHGFQLGCLGGCYVGTVAMKTGSAWRMTVSQSILRCRLRCTGFVTCNMLLSSNLFDSTCFSYVPQIHGKVCCCTYRTVLHRSCTLQNFGQSLSPRDGPVKIARRSTGPHRAVVEPDFAQRTWDSRRKTHVRRLTICLHIRL